jgi:hypothetical protein
LELLTTPNNKRLLATQFSSYLEKDNDFVTVVNRNKQTLSKLKSPNLTLLIPTRKFTKSLKKLKNICFWLSGQVEI